MVSHVRLPGDGVHVWSADDGVPCQPVWWWCPMSARLVMVSHVRLPGDGAPCQIAW